ncbi:MAG TPA: glyoxylate/hydroxypyruvate reductase A [Rhizomicrobium sp.]|jgi:glyoxylate/hydroxypyruvate reductase A
MTRSTLLLLAPESLVDVFRVPLVAAAPHLHILIHGRDSYNREAVDYLLSFRPPRGFVASLPNLKVVFSMGAGVDAFLADPHFPKHLSLVRLVDWSLARDMTEYAVLQILLQHRQQRFYDAAQRERVWRQSIPVRRTEATRIGIMGQGEIGSVMGVRLRDLGFPVAGWSSSRKNIAQIESFAGREEFGAFLARSDYLVCVLPLTSETRRILNRETFAMLPAGAFVINIARGEHLVEADLLEALDSGHLSGAALDVSDTEPLSSSSPLWDHPKIVVTPHIAALSDPRAVARSAIDGIARFERGEPLLHLVDLARGY